jgi:DNA-binding NtrC family response regulator
VWSPDPQYGHCIGFPTLSAIDSILGSSEAAARIRAFAIRAAAVDATVLLTGESGTGKGLLARAIHAESARRSRPLVAVNCASVPDALFESEFFGHARGAFTGAQQAHRGLIEQADGGTLFLDEIGELSPALQAKLLVAIEDREFRRVGGERVVRVDIRVIAATSIDLERAVAEGAFRRDLFHRLMVLSFHLPALRERDADLELFAHQFVERFAARYGRPVRGIDDSALDRLRSETWPGNIRQLANTIEAAVLGCDGPRIAVRHLPHPLLGAGNANVAFSAHSAPDTPERAVRRFRYSRYGSVQDERRRIEDALRRWRGNKTRAAAELGMARNTLREKLRQLEQDVSERDRAEN